MDLKDIKNQYHKILVDVNKLTQNLSEEEFNLNPNSSSWSIAQCIDHLILTMDLYIDGINSAIEKSSRFDDANQKIKLHFFMKYSIRLLEPPYKMKMKTVGIIKPKSLYNIKNLVDQFSERCELFMELITKSEKIDINQVLVKSPLVKYLKFSLAEVFLFHAAHIRRHLWQAGKVKPILCNKK